MRCSATSLDTYLQNSDRQRDPLCLVTPRCYDLYLDRDYRGDDYFARVFVMGLSAAVIAGWLAWTRTLWSRRRRSSRLNATG